MKLKQAYTSPTWHKHPPLSSRQNNGCTSHHKPTLGWRQEFTKHTRHGTLLSRPHAVTWRLISRYQSLLFHHQPPGKHQLYPWLDQRSSHTTLTTSPHRMVIWKLFRAQRHQHIHTMTRFKASVTHHQWPGLRLGYTTLTTSLHDGQLQASQKLIDTNRLLGLRHTASVPHPNYNQPY